MLYDLEYNEIAAMMIAIMYYGDTCKEISDSLGDVLSSVMEKAKKEIEARKQWETESKETYDEHEEFLEIAREMVKAAGNGDKINTFPRRLYEEWETVCHQLMGHEQYMRSRLGVW